MNITKTFATATAIAAIVLFPVLGATAAHADDTPWGPTTATASDDTPWGPMSDDTPWGPTSDDTPWGPTQTAV
ncbi:hypothetical protein AB0H12_21835 [Actinosynnema sp. NPDC023794]